MKHGWIALLAFLLTACTGTVSVKQVEPNSSPVVDISTHGVVLSSSSFSGNYPADVRLPWGATESHRCESYQMLYRYLEESDERVAGQLSAIPNGENDWTMEDPHDYEVENGLGFVAATILPAGRYEVYFYSNICRATSYYPREAFSIPFEVKPGTATYLGEIIYTHRFYENFAGVTVPSAPDMAFRSLPERDLPLLHEKYPFVKELTQETVQLPWSLRF